MFKKKSKKKLYCDIYKNILYKYQLLGLVSTPIQFPLQISEYENMDRFHMVAYIQKYIISVWKDQKP